jgi:hypothetical protein
LDKSRPFAFASNGNSAFSGDHDAARNKIAASRNLS